MASPAHKALGKGEFPLWWPWLLGGLFIVVFALRDYLASHNWVVGTEVFWGRGFINMWTGGHLIREGRLDVLYDISAYSAYQEAMFGDIGPHNYSYPPISFPLVTLISLMPYGVALYAWLAVTGLFFAWAARPWWQHKGWWWLAAMATPAALVNIWAGHYGFLMGGLFLMGWNRLSDRPIQAGIFFGLMLIKPHLALFVPLVLALRGEWRAIASAAATVALLIGLSGLVYGWEPWVDYVSRTLGVQASMIDPNGMMFRLMTPSTASALHIFHLGWPIAIAAQCVVSAFALFLVVSATLRRVSVQSLAPLVATCTFIALPYSFNYDLTVVSICAWALMMRPEVSSLHRRLALYGFIAPQFGMVLAIAGLPLMGVLLMGLAWAQYSVALRDNGSADLSGRGVPATAAAVH